MVVVFTWIVFIFSARGRGRVRGQEGGRGFIENRRTGGGAGRVTAGNFALWGRNSHQASFQLWARTGKLNLRTGTGWRAFLQCLFCPLVHIIFLEREAKSFLPVIFPPFKLSGDFFQEALKGDILKGDI